MTEKIPTPEEIAAAEAEIRLLTHSSEFRERMLRDGKDGPDAARLRALQVIASTRHAAIAARRFGSGGK